MLIKLLASLLLLFAAYLGWWAVASGSFWWLAPCLFALVAASGLFLGKRWAQYLWHVIALVVSISWLSSVVRVALSGWPYDTAFTSFVSLLPGLLLLIVCAGGSAIVTKHFRGIRNAL